jgi:hypothetical protein
MSSGVVVQFENFERGLLRGKKDLKRKVRKGLAKGAKKTTERAQTAPLPALARAR